MSLSQHDITLVQTTFSQIEPIVGTAADLFYRRLFDIDPSLRVLFPEDMRDQKRKLMQIIDVAVNGLNRLDEIAPSLRALGARHTGYGVKANTMMPSARPCCGPWSKGCKKASRQK
jgi:hemoglobin-like flavoprotein